jgi:hypothetical protein
MVASSGKPPSPQEWREIGDNVLHEIRESLDRFKNQFTLSNPRFVERYVEGESEIGFHFSISDLGREKNTLPTSRGNLAFAA